MTVLELIEQLNKFPKDLQVYLIDEFDEQALEISEVKIGSDNEAVYINGV